MTAAGRPSDHSPYDEPMTRRMVPFDSHAVDEAGTATVEVGRITPAGPALVGEVLVLDCDDLDMVVHGEVWGLDEAAGTAVVRVEIAR